MNLPAKDTSEKDGGHTSLKTARVTNLCKDYSTSSGFWSRLLFRNGNGLQHQGSWGSSGLWWGTRTYNYNYTSQAFELSDTLLETLTQDIKSKWAINHKKDQRMSLKVSKRRRPLTTKTGRLIVWSSGFRLQTQLIKKDSVMSLKVPKIKCKQKNK